MRFSTSTNILVASTIGISVGYLLGKSSQRNRPVIPSPQLTLLPKLSEEEKQLLPYPPDSIPGRRLLETPYGRINIYEWGPEDGEKVLLVHGISTPCLALADLSQTLVENGYRVMLFDLFGRGFSDNPVDISQDKRLFSTQILLAISSSPLPWTGSSGFHLVGYSLGGGISAAFTRYFPHLVRSLTLIAPSGLLRDYHVEWKSKPLRSGILPESLLVWALKQRLKSTKSPAAKTNAQNSKKTESTLEEGVMSETMEKPPSAPGSRTTISRYFSPGSTIFEVTSWQIENHSGYVQAFTSSLGNAPIFNQHDDWSHIARRLSSNVCLPDSRMKLLNDKVLFVLGEHDPIIIKEELLEDAQAIFGEHMEVAVLDGAHEVPVANAEKVANVAISFWRRTM